DSCSRYPSPFCSSPSQPRAPSSWKKSRGISFSAYHLERLGVSRSLRNSLKLSRFSSNSSGIRKSMLKLLYLSSKGVPDIKTWSHVLPEVLMVIARAFLPPESPGVLCLNYFAVSWILAFDERYCKYGF